MKFLSLGVFAAIVIQGCGCNEGPQIRNRGEVRIIYTENGAQMQGADGVYDFGTVSMGKTEVKKLTVQNVGLGTLTINAFAKDDPTQTATKVGTQVDDANPVFTIAFGEPVEVGTGESVELDVTYAPPVIDGQTQVPHLVELSMTSLNVAEGTAPSKVTLKGTAVSGECDLPMQIDFGAVGRGDSINMTFDFTNARPIETRGYLGQIDSQQGDGIFTLSPDSPKGEFLIGGNNTKTATFTFRPTDALDYAASVRMRRADGCPEKVVRLIGTGVDAVLAYEPATVNFGYAPPGTTVEREVTITNKSLRAVDLTMVVINDQAQTTPSSIFKVVDTGNPSLTLVQVPGATRDGSNVLVPGTQVVKLSFKPTVLGPRQAQLKMATPFASQQMLSIPLRGIGGGPDIDVRPSPTLAFGRIAYFQGASPASIASRKLTIQNVGTRPNPADPQANLKLGQADSSGYARPYWEVVPKNGSSLDEICVGVFDTNTNTCSNDLPASGAGSYNPTLGLEAGTATSILDIPIRVTPNAVGMREWDVKIFSNDPDEPVTTITVTANSVVLPPCDVEISPIALQFGIVSPPAIKDLAFSIRNRLTGAGDICLISGLELGPEVNTPAGMPAVFTLPGGAQSEIELQPSETKQFVVRAWPQGQLPPTPAAVSGKVVFNVASPSNPAREVALAATIANSCLTISPNALDFGTVKKDCNSETRTFNVYNSCSSAVVINSSSMGAPAGEGPGGPNCMGTTPCPEFHIVAGIPANTTVAAGATTPISFQLRYRPINYGPDTGAFVLNVTQGGQALDYVIALQGRGDMNGLNTDTFRQDSKPKADILLVIDDSCSMSDKQASLAANMNSFLQYATSNQVEFQMAVVVTELSDSTRAHFKQTAAGNKILRPTTPNLQSEFSALVQVGIPGGSESCMEPATLALTAPLITDPTKNAGFLRNDAVLAVVCVTDAPDQAPQAPVFYLNQLVNIKGAQRASQFTYNVIGPFLPSSPSGCSYDGTNDGRHAFMVSQTNGVKEEICTPNWAVALERIGKNAFGYRTNFFLTSRPDLSVGPPVVAIDGMVIPERDQDPALNSKIWEYDATNNSINFEPLYVPEPGRTLTVTYTAACL
ncbi:MAG: hypothetical protein ACO1OB_08080 [Archangium sp.]